MNSQVDFSRRALVVEGAVKPGGCYSHVVLANGFAYVAGQGPADPTSGIVSDKFADQVRQTLQNLQLILRGVGLDLGDIVKMNVYLTDPTRFAEYNEIYAEFFPLAPPARTTIGCWLPRILIEIDCVAAVPQSKSPMP